MGREELLFLYILGLHQSLIDCFSSAFQSLRGTLPEELRLLTNLESLSLRYNADIEGEFPDSIRSLTNLRLLSMEHCSLAGTLPDWLNELTMLTSLGLGDNIFSGVIPESFRTMTSLITLGLDDNAFVADLSLFGSLTSLRHLYLDSNSIEGKLTPSLLGQWKELRELDLSNNRISGTIPDQLLSHKQLRVVDLHGNRLKGGLPNLELEANGSLQYLALHDNKLSNRIPTSLGFLVALRYVTSFLLDPVLTNTRSFVMPKCANENNSYDALLMIWCRHLDLSNNNLEGSIPNTLENIFNLEYFFVGENSFTPAPFPQFLLYMEMLRELSLRSIDITGVLPNGIDSLSNLRYLDLSQNRMNGTLPAEISGKWRGGIQLFHSTDNPSLTHLHRQV